ncbi:MAG: thiamine pyrophosphate-dependent enzyme [Dehalococcoidia bacterium]|jgi:indolepyruvate ferredoxin oxidoreductase alpha subunit|nr:thiamine pyrophosphate-dependent enzyme [Dehalococcoidia bacterium]
MEGIDVNAPGTTQLLMGNEAIARGALEGGVGFSSQYPGTPSSEILSVLAAVSKNMRIHTEWSVNEMVACEAAAGASFAGIPALSAMKQNGVNVCSDFLVNVIMTGIGTGGLVLVTGDDPSAISSSNEEDSRWICKWMDMPLLEPSTAQDAKDMVKWAFEISRLVDNPCFVRETTRLAHTRGKVVLGELPTERRTARFPDVWDMCKPAKSQFTSGPFGILHHRAHERLKRVVPLFEASAFNTYEGPEKPELLVITSGVCHLYCQEAVAMLGVGSRVGIFRLGTTWPLPEQAVRKQLERTTKVLFVEEIDAFTEGSVMEFAASLGGALAPRTFLGKRSGHIPSWGALSTDLVAQTLGAILNVPYKVAGRDAAYSQGLGEAAKMVPPRAINLCPGCPHRGSYWIFKNALAIDGRHGLVAGDIGCYSLGFIGAGFFQERTMHCMGGGVGVANGLGNLKEFGFDQPVLAIAGDSTFFHACIPALVNGVYNKANFIFAILDNSATAMTGFQPHPGVGRAATGDPAPRVDMEALCRALDARVEVCDPFDLEGSTRTLLDMIADESGGARVLIMRRVCELVRGRRDKARPYTMRVNPSVCVGDACGCNRLCIRVFGCPGLIWDQSAGRAKIDEAICTGCGLCADICPQKAIEREAA